MFGHFRWVQSVLRRLSVALSYFFCLSPIHLCTFLAISLSISSFRCSAVALGARIGQINREEYERIAEHFLLPEDFDLAEKIPTQKPTAQELDSILNHELFEGDILGMTAPPTISSSQNAPIDVLRRLLLFSDEGHQRKKEDFDGIFSQPYYSSLNTQTYADKLWHDGKVPYMLEEGMTAQQRAAIASAFDEYKGKTCIRFVPRQSSDPDFIYVKRNYGLGCSSYVGRAGGNQTVSLEVDKCFSKGIIAHELMHALGFFHEHSRTDRDEYVDILEDNIRPGMMRNFEKYPKKIIDPLGMPYDYGSVMHYHKLAFSRNGKSTIVPKSKIVEIGQRHKLSEIDARKVNKLYRCDDDGTTEETTLAPKVSSKTTNEAKTTTEEMAGGKSESATTIGTNEEETGEETSKAGTEEPTTTATTTEEGDGAETTTDNGTEESSGTTVEETTPTTESAENERTDKKETKARRTHGERKSAAAKRTKWSNWPKKYITLSIWSTRSGRKRSKGGGTTMNAKGTGTPTGGLVKIGRRGGGERCVDFNAHCEMWERLGHCVHSVKYMRHYCRKSCGFCGESGGRERTDQLQTCTDRNHFCTYWAQNDECDKGSKFMKLFCKKSCKLC